jgi:hypothetical protein
MKWKQNLLGKKASPLGMATGQIWIRCSVKAPKPITQTKTQIQPYKLVRAKIQIQTQIREYPKPNA